MTQDATFEEGGERPLRLRAFEPGDLEVISTLAQDALLSGADMRWDRKRRRLALMLKRFRWEDQDRARRQGRAFERVQAVLAVEDVQTVASQGVSRGDADIVLSLLGVAFEPAEDGAGRLILTFSGDGALAVDVEALEVTLTDVSRPYTAPSGQAPAHPD